MVEVVGDPVSPSILVLPLVSDADSMKISGACFLSGAAAKINFWNGSAYEVVTSA